jgi:hypothetical protein
VRRWSSRANVCGRGTLHENRGSEWIMAVGRAKSKIGDRDGDGCINQMVHEQILSNFILRAPSKHPSLGWRLSDSLSCSPPPAGFFILSFRRPRAGKRPSVLGRRSGTLCCLCTSKSTQRQVLLSIAPHLRGFFSSLSHYSIFQDCLPEGFRLSRSILRNISVPRRPSDA